jgi:hypothetical protein
MMNSYKIVASMVLIGLGLMSAWVGLTACKVGSEIQYFCGMLALGYMILGMFILPRRKEA